MAHHSPVRIVNNHQQLIIFTKLVKQLEEIVVRRVQVKKCGWISVHSDTEAVAMALEIYIFVLGLYWNFRQTEAPIKNFTHWFSHFAQIQHFVDNTVQCMCSTDLPMVQICVL